jgi:hypothetical protein
MRGWLYVITNRAMPGLVKVGFSTKDPQLRARTLNNTGAPHPYVVAYDVLVRDPQVAERLVHQRLKQYSEGKEWFRCSLELVRDVIRGSLGDRLIFDPSHQEHVLPEADANQAPEPSALNAPRPSACDVDSAPADSRDARSMASEGPRDSEIPQPKSRGPMRRGIRHTAVFQTNCGNCQHPYSVTLTRYDTVARCPRCKTARDVTEYLKSRFML